MATALIPEVIQPGVLYSPSNHNQFSVMTSQLPNTDPGLRIRGDLGRFRAYQPAISGIHYPALATDEWTILYWYYFITGAGSGTSAILPAQMIACVQDAAPVGGAVGSSLASTSGFAWGISLSNAGQPGTVTIHRAMQTSRRELVLSQNLGTAGTWGQGLVFRSPGTNAGPEFVDFELNSKATSFIAQTPSTLGPLVSPFFSLGAMSLQSGWGSADFDIRIAKFALFNYYITDAELLDLQDSMANGPASP